MAQRVEHIPPGGGAAAVSTLYFVSDHLGSIAVIMDGTGAVVERLSYDAWGKRRFTDGTDDAAGTITSQTTRGFTGHEMIDEVGLVNMNGRVYDPEIGRFMSADPFVQDPTNTQSLNRYSYVGNNPLSYADPSGYFLKKIFNAIGSFFKSVFNAIKSLLSNPRALFSVAVGIALFFALGPAGLELGSLLAGGISGGVAGFIATGTLMGALIGAGPGMAAAGVASIGIPTNSVVGVAGNAAAYGTVGGVAAELGGGKFFDGFATGSFFYLAGQFVNDHILSNANDNVASGRSEWPRYAQADTGTRTDAILLDEILVKGRREPTIVESLRSGEALGTAATFAAIAATVDGPLPGGDAVGLFALGAVGLGMGVVATHDYLARQDPRVQIYRAVDAVELAHIQSTGNYGFNPSASGKYFALTVNGVEAFASSPLNAGTTITSTTLPQSIVNQGFLFNDPGQYGAGASVFFDQAQLPLVYDNMTPIVVHK